MPFEFFDTCPDMNVQEAEYKRLLGYPREYELHGLPKELMDGTRHWYDENGKPWIYARHIDALELSGGKFRINGIEFNSKRVYEQLVDAEAESVVVTAVSAGKNCEGRARQLWKEEKPDEYFFMEMYGSAVVEHLIASAAGRICAWADQNMMAALPRYSPGYPEWDILEQHKLFEVIRKDTTQKFPEEIHVMHTGMLNPKKSLLAVFGITKHLEKAQSHVNLIPCENCSLPNCKYRRAPYRRFPKQIEDVNQIQSGTNGEIIPTMKNGLVLTPNAKYSLSLKALEKWSKERLTLKILDDQSVQATFRYGGTTCSNMGHPLEFDYHIKLGSSEKNYHIIDAKCVPAPEDTGHELMCQYLEEGDALIETIANEKPLLGKPLNDVLAWKREFNPSGCFCKPESREYKWGLVFEVLHYALAQKEKIEV